jgi:UrcA family protein
MHSDVRELYSRIAESAHTACAQLAALSPLADLDTQSCEQQARDEAWQQAQKLIDAAIRGS